MTKTNSADITSDWGDIILRPSALIQEIKPTKEVFIQQYLASSCTHFTLPRNNLLCPTNWGASQFYIQLIFKAPLCITLTISDQKIVSGSLFFQFLRAKIENLEKNYNRVIM